MSNSQILDMPVKLRLEFMAVISPDLTNAKRELFDDVIDEINGIGLCVFLIDFQGTYACRIVDCRVLEAANLLAFFAFECREFNIHLDMMAGDLFLVSLRVNLPHSGAPRKTVQTMAAKNAGNGCVGHFYVVVALQIPNNPHWAEVIFAPKVQHLLFAFGRRSVGVPLWDRRRIHKPGFSAF